MLLLTFFNMKMWTVMTETRGRWTRKRQVNRPTVGASDKLRHKQRQVIRNRCSGGHPASKWDRQTAGSVCGGTEWRWRHSDGGDIWVYKRPPAVLSETDNLEGQSWAYTPCDCHCLRQHAGSGKIWEEFLGGSMWCCWIDWDHETLYPFSTAHQVADWGRWLLSDYCVWPRANCGLWVSF